MNKTAVLLLFQLELHEAKTEWKSQEHAILAKHIQFAVEMQTSWLTLVHMDSAFFLSQFRDVTDENFTMTTEYLFQKCCSI